MAVTRSSKRKAARTPTHITTSKSPVRKRTKKTSVSAKKNRMSSTSSTVRVSSSVDATRKTNYFLVKSESETRKKDGHEMKFSIDDLVNETDATTHWDGVRNSEASKCMTQMAIGDLAFFYHSNTKKSRPAIVGIVKVVSEAYADHTAFDVKDPHYDSRSKKDSPRWYMVDVQFVRKFATAVTLDQVKAEARLSQMQLIKRSRISVQSVTAEEWAVIHEMAGERLTDTSEVDSSKKTAGA